MAARFSPIQCYLAANWLLIKYLLFNFRIHLPCLLVDVGSDLSLKASATIDKAGSRTAIFSPVQSYE